MRSNQRRDTGPERAVRSAAHAAGLRYRVDFGVKPSSGRKIRPDLVFPRRKVAVFVDGCFWHGCPKHGTLPATNRSYWKPKIAENRARDRRHTAALEADGWTVVRVWEHEAPAAAVEKIKKAVLVDRLEAI
jgi:DNA mismatch endonuclease (patch repair protein)